MTAMMPKTTSVRYDTGDVNVFALEAVSSVSDADGGPEVECLSVEGGGEGSVAVVGEIEVNSPNAEFKELGGDCEGKIEGERDRVEDVGARRADNVFTEAIIADRSGADTGGAVDVAVPVADAGGEVGRVAMLVWGSEGVGGAVWEG
jgi:hypothetical protein